MAARRYYTLVASLPRLIYFTKAERLPINRQRLDRRLRMLEREDRAELARAEQLTRWQRQQVTRTHDQLMVDYQQLMSATRNQALRTFVRFRMGLRTVLAAYRLRRQGMDAPPGRDWGAGPWWTSIRSHWNQRDFGLAALLPWLPEVRRLFDAGDAIGLEEQLMRLVWRRLSSLADTHPFGFEEVFAYVFKWDILGRWLSHQPEPATARFRELIEEVIGEQRQLFH